MFSTGNVYPFVSADGRGANEDTPAAPLGSTPNRPLLENVFSSISRTLTKRRSCCFDSITPLTFAMGFCWISARK